MPEADWWSLVPRLARKICNIFSPVDVRELLKVSRQANKLRVGGCFQIWCPLWGHLVCRLCISTCNSVPLEKCCKYLNILANF